MWYMYNNQLWSKHKVSNYSHNLWYNLKIFMLSFRNLSFNGTIHLGKRPSSNQFHKWLLKKSYFLNLSFIWAVCNKDETANFSLNDDITCLKKFDHLITMIIKNTKHCLHSSSSLKYKQHIISKTIFKDSWCYQI